MSVALHYIVFKVQTLSRLITAEFLFYQPFAFASTGIFLLQAFACGGDNEIRTHDPLLARQVLSQLSYTPTISSDGSRQITFYA